MDEINISIDKIKEFKDKVANSKLAKIADKILDYTYHDIRVRTWLDIDADPVALFFIGLQAVHMFVFYYFVEEFFGSQIMRIPGHDVINYTVLFGSYFVARRLVKKPIIGIPFILLTSTVMSILVAVDVFGVPDFVWGAVVFTCFFVFLTSLHMSMYVEIPSRRMPLENLKRENYKGNRKQGTLGKIDFNEEEFNLICKQGLEVSELIKKAKNQSLNEEYDVVFTRCRQAVEKSLKVLYYYKEKEYPADLNEAINGLNQMDIKKLTEEELTNLHQLRIKANKAVHNSNKGFAEWEAKFAIEQAELLCEKVKSEVGQAIF